MEPYFQVSLHTQLSYKLSEFPERLMLDNMGLELLVQEKKKKKITRKKLFRRQTSQLLLTGTL